MTAETAPSSPLGVVAEADGLRVGVFSANATAVQICVFDRSDKEISRTPLTRGAGDVWRGFVPGGEPGARYGFRVEGPFDPARGHRFDASKLLADPYAAVFDRAFVLHPSQFARGVDSASNVPKAVVATPSGEEPGRRRVADDRLVIYELNVRGFSRLHPGVPEAARGRFAALSENAVLDHLQGLGVTGVEVMPADIFVDERHLPPLGLANAWGYNSVVFGAPDPRLAPGGWQEIRAATDALHTRGMEAILDVAFNHNGESDQFGPTLSFRGLDNASYFRLETGDLAAYVNDCGTGNCLRLDHPAVASMALNALRRWTLQGGIDGFRFDLATALGRRDGGFDPCAPLIAAIGADPVLRNVRLIAEPWDVGPGGYRVGAFPESWGEWNDHFRDGVRRFWRGDSGARGDFATRLAGSRDLFGQAPSAAKSVNFVVAHDGFTLADLVSYAAKHNEANGEGNRDGSSDNCSWNNGVEGPTRDAAVVAARRRDQRNLIATLAVARGVPMLAMGAELGFSQSGNNNAYAQENATTWIDWSAADAALTAFAARAFAARRDHLALRSCAFLTGGGDPPDVRWLDSEGPLDSAARWEAEPGDTLGLVLSAHDGAALDRCAVLVNRSARSTRFALPEPSAGMSWAPILDSSDDEGRPSPLKLADAVDVGPRTTLVLAETKAARAPPRLSQIDRLAEAAGLAPVWFDISGKRTDVGADTKTAALAALGLPAGTEGEAHDSLARLVDETSGRIAPVTVVSRIDRPPIVSLSIPWGAKAPALDYAVALEDGSSLNGRADAGESREIILADGRKATALAVTLPEVPVGRHHLRIAGVDCALIVAPGAAWFPDGLVNPRFGLAAQVYAQRRPAEAGLDQGVGDLSTLARLAERAGAEGAATLAFSPLHALFPAERSRTSPYSPSDRRFIDPHYIDAFDDADVAADEGVRAAIESAPGLAALRAAPDIDYSSVWRAKRPVLLARARAFARARAADQGSSLARAFDSFVAEGGEALRRYALYEALAETPLGLDWRVWPAALKAGDARALDEAERANADAVGFALFLQFLADRQLARAANRAKAAGLDLGLYRDLAVGAAPDGAESWSRQGELATGLTIGAPPDPFSAQGQNWNIPPLNPIAGAREGWRGFAGLYRANMRHAGLLRVDHAMGLTRLFVLPDGGKPADGTYLALPFNDLLGIVALESQRARCALVGEDLGTVPEGFRAAMEERDVLGMSVLWFERANGGFADPKSYRSMSVASVSTHDLATLAGWWIGADIGERLMLGLDAPDAARKAIEAREADKRAIVDALTTAGLVTAPPPLDAPLSDDFAAAIHAYVSAGGALLALAQLDDCAGETVGTNLPGTDRERANWRRRLAPDVDAALSGARGRAILHAMAQGRLRPA